jgi:hypothetical protein
MRAYEPIMREAAAREIEGWPDSEPFAVHPSMQAITLEVILRAVFGVERRDLADLLRELLRLTASAQLQFLVLLARRVGGPDPLARFDALTAQIDKILLAEIAGAPRRPRDRPSAPTSARCSSRRASRTASRWTTARSATSCSRCSSPGTRPRPPRWPGRSTCSRTTQRRSSG